MLFIIVILLNYYRIEFFLLNLDILYKFQNGKQMVQEGALTALASVADSSQVFLGTSFFI